MKNILFGIFVWVAVILFTTATEADDLSAWSEQLDGKSRFVRLKAFDGRAVLDLETQLVWERQPTLSQGIWGDAIHYCANLRLNRRMGWRLPSFYELSSLFEVNSAGHPVLPDNHPFIGIQKNFYWSSTTVGNDPAQAWLVSFDEFFIDEGVLRNGKNNTWHIWCVRGGSPGPSEY